MRKKEKGFTLIELIVVIAIIAILAIMAAPSFSRMIARSNMQTSLSEWRSAFYLAQREAIRLKHRVELCPSEDGQNCASDKSDYSVGWIVRDNTSNRLIQDFPPKDKNSDQYSIVLYVGNGVSLNFLNNGRLPSNFSGGSLKLRDNKVTNLELEVNISRAGRISSAK